MSASVDQVQQVLLIVDLATESQDTAYDDAPMGYHLILNCVRDALRYESERVTVREDNVTKLEVGNE